MSRYAGGLWRHPDFLKLWAGQATSMFGSLVGGFAYSFVAILTLHASPAEVAILNGCTWLPGVLAGPWIGVWVDRVRNRPLLVAVDLARAMLLASIPIAALTHNLSMLQLYAVSSAVSVLTMGFDVSFRAYVPVLIGRDRLIAANSVLQGTGSVAEATGFGVSGVLVQLVTAPVAVLFDAVSFLVSAISLLSIRGPDTGRVTRRRDQEHAPFWHDLRAGVGAVWHDRVLRALSLTTFAWEVARGAVGVVIMIFFIRQLDVQPAILGPVCGIGGVSSFLGAVLAGRVVRRWGVGRALIGGLYINNVGLIPIILAGGPLWLIVLLLSLGQATDGGESIFNINAVTLLQTRAPAGMTGRVFGTYETLRSGATACGLVIGGILGQAISLRGVLIAAAVVELLVPLFLFPVFREKDVAPISDRRPLIPA